MKKAIFLLLCCGLVMCSACNKAEPPPTESPILTASKTKATESSTETSPMSEKDNVLFQTPSGYSSTLQIKYDLEDEE